VSRRPPVLAGPLILAALAVLSGVSSGGRPLAGGAAPAERGRLAVYFRDEMVGFEEYTWTEDDFGYTLDVVGRMTKPLDLVVDRLTIRLNKSFIAYSYLFRGSIGGVSQEVASALSDGTASNVMSFGGQETRMDAQVRRDAFLLPNPLFSPYLVLTKRFRCGLAEKGELAAYIIPQLEVSLGVEPIEGAPCRLALTMAGVRVEVETDTEGSLRSLAIPSQSLVVKNSEWGLSRVSPEFLDSFSPRP
jgi:hypothetical protein